MLNANASNSLAPMVWRVVKLIALPQPARFSILG
ncbi:Uncharacterised protein [Vibrio cholerae]|nr:Uncharacterised protein [Vibrio cholerae]